MTQVESTESGNPPAVDDRLARPGKTDQLAQARHFGKAEPHFRAIGTIVEAHAPQPDPAPLAEELVGVAADLQSVRLEDLVHRLAHALRAFGPDDGVPAQQSTAVQFSGRHFHARG